MGNLIKRRKISEDGFIAKKNINIIFNGIFGCMTEVQVESAIGFAKFLSAVGINQNNYLLFIKLLETNNKWIIDALIGKRNPRLLFSTIRLNKYLIRKTFKLLTLWHPGQIYEKVLLALLGVVENAYHSPDDGYRIYKLRIADLNNVGKYLDKSKEQSDDLNAAVLDVLDRIAHIGEFKLNINKSIISKHAFNIRFAYFDNTKNLTDTIPHVLLVKIKREEYETKPSKKFINFLTGNK